MGGIDPVAVLGLAGVPVTTGLTEVVKRLFPELPSRAYPAVALVISLALNVGFGPPLGVDLTSALAFGLVAGLAASGLYSAGRELRS